MKRLLILFIWVFCFQICPGQKSIDNLIQSEKNFAAHSVAYSTKEAFLKFLDSSGIVFDNNKPVNGIECWLNREKRTGILNWYPKHAEISSSGDFGYTTGPWTFQPETIDDSVVATGHYTTVWHINKEGEWKFLVDLGTNNNPVPADKGLHKIERTNPEFKPGDEKSLIDSEKEFIKIADGSFRDAYKEHMSVSLCLLKRNNAEPAWFQDAYYKVFDSMPAKIQYSINGSGISVSGDLGYVYGTSVIDNKTDNYLRIWRKEKNGWKIAVEVLRY